MEDKERILTNIKQILERLRRQVPKEEDPVKVLDDLIQKMNHPTLEIRDYRICLN